MSTFSHLNAGGEANMVDVSDKDVTKREATAEGFLYVSEDVIRQISEAKIAKGDVFAVARVAGIQGAKRCADLIPLCHPLPIDHASTKIVLDEKNYALDVYCLVSANAKTGVEMEAIMGVNAALITIYDLSKIVNPDLLIQDIRLLVKQGGKSGLWINPNGVPEFLSHLK